MDHSTALNGKTRSKVSKAKQWAVDNGQLTMGNGQWAMGNGQWAMDNGQWTMDRLKNINTRYIVVPPSS